MKSASLGCLLGLAMVAVVYGKSLSDYESVMHRYKRQSGSGIPNCDAQSSIKLMCIDCGSDQILKNDKSACLACPPSCTTCVERPNGASIVSDGKTLFTTCNICDAHYTKNAASGICEVCDQGCLKCDTNGKDKCDKDQCDTGFMYANATQECTKCASNCDKCTSAGTCLTTSCQKGTYFRASDKTCPLCSSAIPGCSECSESGGQVTCSVCNSKTLVLSSDKTVCEDCPNNCLECSSSTTCTKCQTAFTLDSGACSDCAAFCTDCSNSDAGPGKCNDNDACWTGYYLKAADKTCAVCPANCDKCKEVNDKVECEKCSAYHSMKAFGADQDAVKSCDFCPEFCTACSMGSDNKVRCNSGRCFSRYALNTNDGTCHACPQNCKACSYSSTDKTTKCTTGQCDAGFTVRSKDGKCYKCPDNCISCTDDGAQTNCIWNQCNTTLSAYNPLTKQCPKCPDNCKTCMVDNDGIVRCTACLARYAARADMTTCDACPSNCKICSNDEGTTNCWDQRCTVGYARKSDGTCQSCAASAGCLDCIFNSNGAAECLKCRTGYAMSDDPVGTGCAQCSNCLDCEWKDNKAQCKVNMCNKGYVRNTQGVCRACPSGCDVCTVEANDITTTCSLGSCTSPGYVQVVTKSCIACPPGASSCSQSGTQLRVLGSDTCMTGYTRSSDRQICVPCPLNCNTCAYTASTAKTTCTQCNGGYALEISGGSSTGQCKQCPSNCASCSSAENLQCTSGNCKSGYVSENGVCVACTQNCLACSTSGTCNSGQCKTGYYLDGNTCTECADRSNCDSCSAPTGATPQCDTCKVGMTINAASGPGDKCHDCPAGCKYCEWVAAESQVKCRMGMCRAGYVMDQERNCKQCPGGCAACSLATDGSGTTVCITGNCKQGYVEASDGSCKSCPSNCETCWIDGSGNTVCDDDGCKPEKAQSSSGTCSNCGNNCKKCATTGTCDSGQCKTNFFYNSGSCSNCHADCQNGCNVAGQCNTGACKDNFGRNSAGACVACTSQYCKNCDGSPGACQSSQCTIEMWNTAGVYDTGAGDCAACAANCTACTTPGQCNDNACYQGFYKNATDLTCWEASGNCAAGCTDCDGYPGGCKSGKCAKSGNLYYMYNSTGNTCFPCGTNCMECNVENECLDTKCLTGFYFNGTDRTCYSCIDTGECDTCNTNGNCLTDGCATGYGYITGNDGTTSECQLCQNECKKCTTAGSCDVNQCVTHYAYDVDEAGVAKCKKIDCNTETGKTGMMVDNTGTCGTRPTGCLAPELLTVSGTTYNCPEGFCMPGYAWNNGACTQCPSDCATCKISGGSTVCLFSGCVDGYARMADGNCKKCPVGCDECEESSTAGKTVCKTSKCSAGYKEIQPMSCMSCHTGCDQCSLSATTNVIGCSFASSTYTLRPDYPIQVYPCPQYCKTCTYPADTARQGNSFSTCSTSQCNSGYAMNINDKTCHACPSSCDRCIYDTTSSDTRCITAGCAFRSAQDVSITDNICHPCPSNCDYCVYNPLNTDTGTTCLCGGCQSGYVQNMVDFTCAQCNVDNCRDCDVVAGTETCKPMQCEIGYQIESPLNPANSYKCVSCGEGCNTCTMDKDSNPSCTACASGYFLYQDPNDLTGRKICSACLSNCATCTDATTCGACKAGYTGKIDGTVHTCEQCPDKCYTCTIDPTTTAVVCNDGSCHSGYGLVKSGSDQGKCVVCASNCHTCTTTGASQCDTNSCDSGYVLTTNSEGLKICSGCTSFCHTCSVEKECNTNGCNSGYVYNSDKKTCDECRSNKAGIGECDTCTYSGNAYKCTKCKSGHALFDGKCYQCEAHCLTCEYDEAGDPKFKPKSLVPCTKCAVGYGRILEEDKQCYACPRNCDVCAANQEQKSTLVCSSCESGFFLNGEQCGLCPRNCKQCGKESMSCEICDARYALYDASSNFKMCAACPANCHNCTYDPATQTTSCNDGNCFSGYAKTPEGQCQSCTTFAFENCGKCTDVATVGSASTCLECSGRWTLKADGSACTSCDGVSASCNECSEKDICPVNGCKSGTTRSESGDSCIYECYECSGANCVEEVTGENEHIKVVKCAPGQQCYEKLTYENKAFVSGVRGCQSANLTCPSSANQNNDCKETSSKGECISCCASKLCNVGGAAEVAANLLLILSATLLAFGVCRA